MFRSQTLRALIPVLAIALLAILVLYLFLRQWRAVLAVGIAVPMSLLAALALLFVFDQSLNLITIFGLAVGIGMLVDNSIVVYEAVQRRIEHGFDAAEAAEEGVRRTVRAIVAASATTAASPTAGCLYSTPSTSTDEMFSPPEIITSLARSLTWM